MIESSPPKGWERLKAKVPFDPKGKQERVHKFVLIIYAIPLIFVIHRSYPKLACGSKYD